MMKFFFSYYEIGFDGCFHDSKIYDTVSLKLDCWMQNVEKGGIRYINNDG